MNHSTVIRDETEDNSTSSSVSHFMLMDGFVATNNVICGVVGFPLNLFTAVFIIFKPRLHHTRNIVWLGVAFSNLLILLEHLFEFYAYQFHSETAKEVFSLVAGLPYTSLMLNLFFLLVDRYVSIAHSAWYKRSVSITWIVSGEIGCFSILCVLMKGPYLVELIPFPAALTITKIKFSSVFGFITLSLCAAGQAFVYFKVKYYLDLEKDAATSLSSHKRAQYNDFARERLANNTQTAEFISESSLEGFRHHAVAASLQNRPVTPSPFFIIIGNETISRLELKAAHHAVDSVSLFFVFFLPAVTALMFAISAGCSSASDLIRQECSTSLWFLTYTRGLMVFYIILSPIFFVIRSHDLSQTLHRKS